MKTQLLGTAAICGIALILTATAARSEISEPDHVIYGTPTWYGAAMESGTVSLALEGDDTRIASYTLGSESA